jgi:hypothetical protein
MLWITQQTGSSNQVTVYPFDLSTKTYGTPLNFTLSDGTNRATGATWAPGALSAVPEPSTYALLMFGAAGVGLWLRRRRSYVFKLGR